MKLSTPIKIYAKPSVRADVKFSLPVAGLPLTPLAFGVLLCIMALDSVIRQYLTLASEYWKTIELPIASFGLIGSGTAILGIFTPRIARILADRNSPTPNLWITSALVLLGLAATPRHSNWALLPQSSSRHATHELP
jgi:hypothetical protein